MPLTAFQRELLACVSGNRTPDSHLAGGTALHFEPETTRYSHDLDFFHDSEERVAEAFAEDEATLKGAGYDVEVKVSQPGLVRALVSKGAHGTLIEWSHDTAWRFLPPRQDEVGGYLLHPVDLAVNKCLALAGRHEIRDFVDVFFVVEEILPLGALVWAAVGKDPGFTPLSLLEQLRRKGRYRPDEVDRLDLARPFDIVAAKGRWLDLLDAAERFVRSRPPEEIGCLYYSVDEARFVVPEPACDLTASRIVPHYGRPGGVLPAPG